MSLIRWTTGTLVISGLLATAGIQSAAQAPDPMVGTWKLIVAKSSFDPGPPPESALVVIKKIGEKTNTALDFVLVGDRKVHFEYTGMQDGSDIPVTVLGGAPFDTVAERRINPRAVARDDKKDGKVTRHQDLTVSMDGRTLTLQNATINAQGVPVNDNLVYEKQ